MFEIFGEFDSAEEINMAADGLLNEGDTSNIMVLAIENGIATEIANMYIDGDIPFICDNETAAVGKIEVEREEMKPVEIVADWIDYIESLCGQDEEFCKAVRKKGKSAAGCIAKLLKWSFENAYDVDSEITKAAKVSAKVKMGIPGMGTAKKMIKEYYYG